jgi:predicted regulator of Ras-like GTPase activity (Roadblock/LC7/MglB family)
MREAGRTLFAEILGDADLTALLVDSRGDHLAGSFLDADGREAGPEIGAALSGVGLEVSRAMRHLDLGEWQALVIETESATIALSSAGDEAVVLLAAAAEEPHGLVRRVLTRCVDRANHWLAGKSK